MTRSLAAGRKVSSVARDWSVPLPRIRTCPFKSRVIGQHAPTGVSAVATKGACVEACTLQEDV